MRPPRVSRAWKRVSKKVFVRNAVYHTTVVATAAAATVASLVRTSPGPAESFLLLLVEIRLVFTRS